MWGSGSESGSVCQRHGFADPNLHQNIIIRNTGFSIMIHFRTTQQKEQKLQQREIDRELLINR
jgi:hypothetical protein